MSFTSTRKELALALTTVPGLTGYERRPRVLKLGDAWPLLERAEHGPGDAWSGTWRVLLFLGGDEDAATTFMDDTLPLLVAALETQDVAYVDSAFPAITKIDGNDTHIVEVRARSE